MKDEYQNPTRSCFGFFVIIQIGPIKAQKGRSKDESLEIKLETLVNGKKTPDWAGKFMRGRNKLYRMILWV